MSEQKKYVSYDNEAYIWEKSKNKFVAKEIGKGLSEANFTQDEKTKLAGITPGAEVNVNADWNATTGDAAVLNKPTALSDFTNDLNDASTTAHGLMSTSDKTKLNGIAAGAEVNVQSDWNESSSSSDAYIMNKPTKLTDFNNDGNFVQDASYVHITVDTTMSDSSNNPISNAVVKDYIDDAIGGITGFDFEVVQTLPATGEKGIIYLVSNSGSNPNSYDEYIWITVSGTSKFEKIGTTDIDLSGYQLSADLIPLTTAEIDAICV